jgi:hypothetical protein
MLLSFGSLAKPEINCDHYCTSSPPGPNHALASNDQSKDGTKPWPCRGHATPPCHSSPCPLLSPQPCPGDSPLSPDHDHASPWPRRDAHCPAPYVPRTPSHASACTLATHGRARARARPVASVLPLTSASAQSITTTPATRQTCPLTPPCPVSVVLVDDFRRTSGRRRSLPSHPVHLFLRQQELDDRHDARNHTPSSPCPFAAQRAIAMDASVNPRSTPRPL